VKILFDFRSMAIACTTATLVGLSACNSSSPPNSAPQDTDSAIGTTHPSSTKTLAAEAAQPDVDVDYMTSLGLIKGQLLVAKELLGEGKADKAEPHIGDAAGELYSDIQEELTQRQVPEFTDTLNQLHNLVESAPDDPQIETEYQASLTAIETAIEAVPLNQRQSAAFGMAVVTQILQTANQVYGNAIVDGKIVNAIEYQDSRGFILYADELYQGIVESIKQQDQTIHREIETNFAQLETAWPSVNPPETPVMTPEQVSELVNQIAESTQKL
jgi:hypothetical protein